MPPASSRDLVPDHQHTEEPIELNLIPLISNQLTITGSIMGAGVSKGRRAVRWGVAGNILTAWLLTLPMSALMAAACYEVVHAIIEH